MQRLKRGLRWSYWLVLGLPLWVFVATGSMAAAQDKQTSPVLAPLQMGLLPYISTRKLFAKYIPLQRYLEKLMQRPVRMSTAPDFATYIERARRGQYDIYVTAPHFALQAESAFSYRRLSRFSRELDGSIIVARDGPIKTVGDLRGRTFRTPDALAIVTLLGEQWLQANNLQPGIDVQVSHAPSHNAAVLAVARGEVAAAVSATDVFENMSQNITRDLRVLANTKKVPNVMFMAGPRLSEADLLQVRAALLAFAASASGKAFISSSGYVGMEAISAEDMQRLTPFVAELAGRVVFSAPSQPDVMQR